MDLSQLKSKVNKYNAVKQNTIDYRQVWHDNLKDTIIATLEKMAKEIGLEGEVEHQDNVKNLEAVVYNLGRRRSGIMEVLDHDETRSLVRNDGMLVYQQLFNGKILVMIVFPHVEGYGEPQPPKNLEILRPHELTESFMIRHFEEMLMELTNWEDYDDDQPSPPPIGFNTKFDLQNEDDMDMDR